MKRVDMAQIFNVSVDTIYRWCARLEEELRKDAVNIQPRDLFMESLNSIRTVRAEAWKGYYEATTARTRSAIWRWF